MNVRTVGILRTLVMRVATFIRHALPMMPLLLSACATSTENATTRQTGDLVAASRDEIACRNTIAAKPRYHLLATRMPLATVFDATLPQMAASTLASDDEVAALELWLNDTRTCRKQLADEVLRASPASLGILVTNWNKDDEAFVLLATRKVAWGKTIMKLRANRAEMLDGASHEILQLVQQMDSEKQAELTRRVAIFNALTNLAP
jgi:hypothetical protein